MRLAWFLTWRDIRQGGATLLCLALIISVTAVSAVGLLADRVRQALASDAQATLAADLVLVSDRAPPSAWREQASQRGLRLVEGSQFPTMAQVGSGENMRGLLVALKTVSDGYPLRGSLLLQTASGRIKNGALGLDEAWIDPALAASLNIAVGDRLTIGALSLRVSALIVQEPDRGMNFVNLSPRVMIRHERLQESGLIAPGSRISYRLWVAAQPGTSLASIQQLNAAIAPTLGRGQRIESLDNARPELRNALDRAYAFLSLTGMLASLTAAAAVALAAQRFVLRHLQTCAVLKSMGATQMRLNHWWALELFVVTLASIVIGLALGWLMQSVLAGLAAKLLSIPLGGVSLTPLAQAAGVAGAMVLGFAVPPLLGLRRVSAVRVLRQDSPAASASARLWMVLMIAAVWLLLWLGTGNATLSAVTAIGFLVASLLFAVVAWFIFRFLPSSLGLSGARGSWADLFRWAWQNTTLNLKRRGGSMALQIQGVSMALTALFLLTLVQADLVKAWQLSTPTDAPNRFVLNIQTAQQAAVADAIAAQGLSRPAVYPMVRGRLIEVNGKSVQPNDFVEDRAQRLVDREFNLTYASDIPAHNKIISGAPLNPRERQVSVETGIAKTLGLKLNDRLVFDVAGERIEAVVQNIRALRWDSMQVNFFMILTPAALKDAPQSWITSVYIPNDAQGLPTIDLNRVLLSTFPNLTVFDLSALTDQLQRILSQVISAVQMLFGFALASGVLVLWSALLATRDARLREAAVFRALGASRRQISLAQAIELVLVGGVAGLLAAAAALGIGAALAERVFSLSLDVRWEVLGLGAVLGAAISLLAGWIALRPVLRTPAWRTLREMV